MITRRIIVEPETVIHMKLRNHLVNLKFQLPNSKSKIPLVPQWILSTQILKNWHLHLWLTRVKKILYLGKLRNICMKFVIICVIQYLPGYSNIQSYLIVAGFYVYCQLDFANLCSNPGRKGCLTR